MTTSVSPSEASAAGCSVSLVQTGYAETSHGTPGLNNGPTTWTTTWCLNVTEAKGWTFSHAEVTTVDHYEMWNSKYHGDGSAPEDYTDTISLAKNGILETFRSTQTCAIPFSYDEYHGDHHTLVRSVTNIVAYFTAVDKTAVRVVVATNPADGSKGTATGTETKAGYVGDVMMFPLSATASDTTKYKFVKWVGNGQEYTDPFVFPEFTLKSGYTEQDPETFTFTAYFDYADRAIQLNTALSPGAANWSVSPSSELRVRNGTNVSETFMVFAQDNTPAGQTKEWSFDHWEASGTGVSIVSPNSRLTSVSVDYDLEGGANPKVVTLTAVLKSTQKYRVEVNVADDGSGGGFASGGGSAEKLENEQFCANISATAYIGYRFTGWTSSKGGSGSSWSMQACVTTTTDESQNTVTWTAHFESTEESGSEGPSGPTQGPTETPPPGPSGESASGSVELSAIKVTTSVDHSEMGSATGDRLRIGKVGDPCTVCIEATVSDDKKYKFIGWYENGSKVSNSATYCADYTYQSGYSDERPEIHAFEARFDYKDRSVLFTTAPSHNDGNWATSPAEQLSVRQGSETQVSVLVTAVDRTPQDQTRKYRFIRWTSTASGVTISDPTSPVTTVSCTYPQSGETNPKPCPLTAVLELDQKYSVTINVADDGSRGGFATGGGSSLKYKDEQFCANISATAYIGYRFTGWTSSKGGTMATESGRVCITASDDESQNTVTWTAHFESTEESGSEGSGGQTEGPSAGPSVGPPVGPSGYSGTEERSAVLVTTSTNGATKGTASGGRLAQGRVGETCLFNLQAKPVSKKYKFVGWYENGSLVSTDQFHHVQYTLQSGYSESRPETHAFEARFDYAGPAIHATGGTSTSNSGWSVSPTDDLRVKSGTNTTETFSLIASHDTAIVNGKKYKFVRWTASGGATIASASSQVTTASVTYPSEGETSPKEVYFEAVLEEEEKVTVNFATAKQGDGTASGDTTVLVYLNEQACATLTATPRAGSRFKHWLHNGSVGSTSATATVCLKATRAVSSRIQIYTAVFEKKKVVFTTTVDSDSGWTTTPINQERSQIGSETSASFEIAAGDSTLPDQEVKYDFDHWEVQSGEGVTIANPTALVTDVTVTFPPDNDPEGVKYVTVVAILREREKCSVKITTSGSSGGQVYGSYGPAMRYVGDTVTLPIFAIPNYGCEFAWWECNGAMTGYDSGDVVEVTASPSTPVYAFYAEFIIGGSGSEDPGPTESPGPTGGSGGSVSPGPGPGPGPESEGESGSESPGYSEYASGAAEAGWIVFLANPYVDKKGNRHGTTNPERRTIHAPVGTVVSFSSVATPSPGYNFVKWVDSVGTEVSKLATLSVSKTVTGALQTFVYTAMFRSAPGNILYDPASGMVLYGAGGSILYKDQEVEDGD